MQQAFSWTTEIVSVLLSHSDAGAWHAPTRLLPAYNSYTIHRAFPAFFCSSAVLCDECYAAMPTVYYKYLCFLGTSVSVQSCPQPP